MRKENCTCGGLFADNWELRAVDPNCPLHSYDTATPPKRGRANYWPVLTLILLATGAAMMLVLLTG